MNYKKIGPLEIIMGENDSRPPFSTSMIIKGREYSTVIECGTGVEAFQYMQTEHNIKQIYLTHHHFDHIWGVHHFPEVEKFINPIDHNKILDEKKLITAQGFPAVFEKEELDKLNEAMSRKSFPGIDRWNRASLNITNTYSYGEKLNLSDTTVIMIHSPGHSQGYCCPYLPDYGILYVGDFDLSSFGPFYCDAECDIDMFIESAQKALEVDATYYVTAHQKGILLKEDFRKELKDYLNIIKKRDEIIKRYIKVGGMPKDLIKQGVFYYEDQYIKNPFFLKSEIVGIAKHLQRMIAGGEPFEDYYEAYIAAHNIKEEYLDYQTNF
jgi:hydroxyacylglutathione hydrolase